MSDEQRVAALYRELLNCWNKRDAAAFAALFAEDGQTVGFDGSIHDGRAQILADLSIIFANHPTAAYVGKIRKVRFLTTEVGVVSAVAGMVPSGKSDLNPAVNAMQTLIATRTDGRWSISLFQNTPAAFHGRPELGEQLTAELRQVLREQQSR
ncbi:MAG TPA: SgcJ/EcaC family oxidoreductase [Nitrospira sp.]|nr:SgcJ/EcaC family oxidoreductase [Nitrospira sp.]